MSTLPPPPVSQRDTEHLRLLSIFHYVFAALALVGIGFLCLHYLLMSKMMSPEFMASQPNPPPPEFFGLFLWFYLFAGIFVVIGGALNLAAAQCLRKRRARTFCLVVAGLNCLNMPLGTLLGVFTIIVLIRDPVREIFEQAG